MSKKRWQLVVALFVVFAVAFSYMNLRFDPLARNTSVTSANRSQLMHYLDDSEIRYLVENNIDVNLFLEFLEEPMFQLEQYRMYRTAMDIKPASPKEIVTFINAVMSRISLEELVAAIPNYDYAVLRKLIVDQSPYSVNAFIVSNPYDLETYLDLNHTIGEFAPNDLIELSEFASLSHNEEAIRLRQPAAEALSQLCQFMKESTNQPCGGFVVDRAYVSYHDIQDAYLKKIQRDGAQSAYDEWGMPSHNEHQLGLAVDLLLPHVQVSDMVMHDSFHILSANASMFGFVMYPSDSAMHEHNRRPYHIRYVGVEHARACVEDGVCFYHKYE